MTYKKALEKFQMEFWTTMLDEHGSNITHMAQAAKVHRSMVYKHFKRIGIPVNVRVMHRGNWGDLTH